EAFPYGATLQRTYEDIGGCLVDHPRERRVVLAVRGNRHLQHLGTGEHHHGASVVVNHDEARQVLLSQEMGRFQGRGFEFNDGIRAYKIASAHQQPPRSTGRSTPTRLPGTPVHTVPAAEWPCQGRVPRRKSACGASRQPRSCPPWMGTPER